MKFTAHKFIVHQSPKVYMDVVNNSTRGKKSQPKFETFASIQFTFRWFVHCPHTLSNQNKNHTAHRGVGHMLHC